ncbi:coenzyme dependent N5,N10-methylene tetrahydromethanopterin reductase [Setomelanomma holmii]|uniref:Coenzyme dependent N5,N10-methylene tetrahydromethanopterin reductase n=1 Tax=Setomelanomma holmii TaxID=210430 RepID=A0A9P4LJJ7_9PLEO|nr:coenzyme dependent N5,N10-methylene tetrahydromethanopterin reductase [Setomelanomma holmii]
MSERHLQPSPSKPSSQSSPLRPPSLDRSPKGISCIGFWGRLLIDGSGPDDISTTKDTIKYYTDLAKLTDRGKISAIFFAEWFVGFDVYGGGLDTMLKSAYQVAHLDPYALVLAMAAVTENVSFAVTQSTTYSTPYVLALQYSTLDHLTGGRCAWNIVTSFPDSNARALGHEKIMAHDERYNMADEFMDVVYKLWKSSWASGSGQLDPTTGTSFDADRVKKIEHEGTYFRMSGRSQVHPSPQRTPVLFQAGTSKSGTAFAAKHAEAIFLNCVNVSQAKKVIAHMRVAAAANGRDPASLKFFPCFMPIISTTPEDAKAKHDLAVANADPVAGLAQFSGYTGIDLAAFLLDEPMDLSGISQGLAIQAVFKALETSEGEEKQLWTPRWLGMRMALAGLHPCPVGTASEVADVIQKWIEEANIDGCNIGSVTNPGSWTDVVDLLVPELQRRRLYWDDYDVPGGTFRENLLGTKELRDDHYGASFKWKETSEGTKGGDDMVDSVLQGSPLQGS